MSYAVNLLPASVIHARRRARRGRRWAVLAGAVTAGLAGAWALRVTIERQRQSGSMQALELQRRTADVSREAAELSARISALRSELAVLTQYRRQDRWLERYVQLAASAPAGLVLRELSIRADDAASSPTPAGRAAAARVPAAAPATQPVRPGQDARFRVVAYATDHANMLQFISALQGLVGCHSVELVSAATDTRYHGMGVRFECTGRSTEASP